MFDIGAGEMIGLGIIAIFLVGPERLPKLAVDAAKLLKKARNLSQLATTQLRENLGPGFEDLDVKDLHPKTFIKKHLNEVIEENASAVKEIKEIKKITKLDPEIL
ncbi:MAG: sec-independent translocase [Actinobacteria bacterium]|jgi:sec-independent protein translocase protein TatB|nr:sec-independent translocase [Actinomycetota bacterium]